MIRLFSESKWKDLQDVQTTFKVHDIYPGQLGVPYPVSSITPTVSSIDLYFRSDPVTFQWMNTRSEPTITPPGMAKTSTHNYDRAVTGVRKDHSPGQTESSQSGYKNI